MLLGSSCIRCCTSVTAHTTWSGFPGGSDGKASAHNAGDPGSIPRLGRSPRRKWQPTPVRLPRKFHRWRSLVGYSPWGRKESDMTERLHFLSFFLSFTSMVRAPLQGHSESWVGRQEGETQDYTEVRHL